MFWLIGALAIGGLGVAAGVRLAGDDPAVWHVDPLIAPPTGAANAYRLAPAGSGAPPAAGAAPVFGAAAADIAAAVDAHALTEPRTRRIAGGPEALWATYVQRSRMMGFPDYVSVRFIELGPARSTLAIFSRARFGRSDLGVNRARVERWLAALAASAPREAP